MVICNELNSFKDKKPNDYSIDINISNNSFATSSDLTKLLTQTFESSRNSLNMPDKMTNFKSSNDISNKVFVGGLRYSTDDEAFKNYFSKYGTLTDCVVIKDPSTKKSRGFGFVKYSESNMVDELMRNRPHTIDGRSLDLKRITPRKHSTHNTKINETSIKKIFIGRLDDSIDEHDLREYFSQFGNITNVTIKRNKEDAKSRGFAFICFDDYDPVDKIILLNNHRIKSIDLNVEKAIPKEFKEPENRNRPTNKNFKSQLTQKTNASLCAHCFQCRRPDNLNTPTNNQSQSMIQPYNPNMGSNLGTLPTSNIYASYNLDKTNPSMTNLFNKAVEYNKFVYTPNSGLNDNRANAGPIRNAFKPNRNNAPYTRG
jgi:RNA recognition motif-containing protein